MKRANSIALEDTSSHSRGLGPAFEVGHGAKLARALHEVVLRRRVVFVLQSSKLRLVGRLVHSWDAVRQKVVH